MKIDIVSDLHGYKPNLEGGDVLIIAGDLTARPEQYQLYEFEEWVYSQSYTHKLVVPGNHDTSIDLLDDTEAFRLLIDEAEEIDGIVFYGSPWTKRFHGMNPSCMAFTVKTESELEEKWNEIPGDTNVLICHGPMLGYLDKCSNSERAGSSSLLSWFKNRPNDNLRMFICGHIHEGHGIETVDDVIMVNASVVDQKYRHVHDPSVFHIPSNERSLMRCY